MTDEGDEWVNPLDRAEEAIDAIRAEEAQAKRDAEQSERDAAAALSGSPAAELTNVSDLTEHRRRAWLDAMVARAVERLQAAPEGQRNDELNRVSYTLGGIVHLGLAEDSTRKLLTETGVQIGLTDSETHATVESGWGAGISKPMTVELAERSLMNGAIDVGTTDPSFWSARPELSQLFTAALARRVSPWAVLGVQLARVVACAPFTLVLPPIIGGYGSLNIFVGLVGLSGAGKGGAERAAGAAFTVPYTETVTVGSGEGIAHSYVKRNRSGDVDQHTERVLFSVPEVDTLTAVGSRAGATLLPELRRAWSGEALGFAYADPTKRLRVEPHHYRMSLILGIQPGRAQALLKDADGGTPQRFLWLPAFDRHAPDVAPDMPHRMHWEPPIVDPRQGRTIDSLNVMGVCELARRTIDDAALARLRGEQDALDGHLLYAQLKCAAALCLLNGRLDISEDDWALADQVMTVSQRTRTVVTETLQEQARAKNVTAADSYAQRTFIVADKAAERDAEHEERVKQRVTTLLQGGVVMPRNEIRRGVRHNYRHAFDEAFAALLDAGVIVPIELQGGATCYALKP